MRHYGLTTQTFFSVTSAFLVLFAGQSLAAADDYGIPGARERFEIWRNIVADKLDRALLPAMRNHDIDMWIVLDRENNDDPLHAELGADFPAYVRHLFSSTMAVTSRKRSITDHIRSLPIPWSPRFMTKRSTMVTAPRG